MRGMLDLATFNLLTMIIAVGCLGYTLLMGWRLRRKIARQIALLDERLAALREREAKP